MPDRQAAIIAAIRTPVGRYGGALAPVRPDDMAALCIREVIGRTGIDPALIDDVYFGAANQAGEDNRNVARMAALLAGLPDSVPGCTVNRLCASSLDAVNVVARLIESNVGDVYIAGGVESMSRAPFVIAKSTTAYDRNAEMYDTTIGWRFSNPRLTRLHHPYSMGETAENVAERHQVSREDQDRFALASQQKCKAAMESGRLAAEIIPVEIPQRKGDPIIVDKDEHPRPETTLDRLAKLRPAFREGGTVTAGNASGVNDGAAALLIVEAGRAAQLGLQPLAIVGPHATAGVDPACMGLGPVDACRKLSHRHGVKLANFDHVELNEAFAAQSLACIRQLELDPLKVNPNGGAIALGHPLGMTGARLVTTIVHEMQARPDVRRSLATLCVGVGQGVATAVYRA